ncbi:glutathione S-transferase [soil metagenome]
MHKGAVQPLPILYSFRRCPYAMRARMAVLANGQEVELREVVLSAKPQAFLDASPKGTVPVLALPDGRVVEQSLDIMLWALRGHDPDAWLGGQDAPLIAANDGPFKHHLDRYKYAGRYESDPLLHRTEGLALLASLESRLAIAPFLCGPARTLTDIAIFPFVRQFAATDQRWFDAQPLPRLQRWLAGHIESPLFRQAMARVPPWVEGQDGIPWGG